MNFKLLNNMIDYIDENLENDIEYKKLSKIMGISMYSIERIFTFLTGISINEYIKRRRLSKAYEEIKNTNYKIIDIAFKYKFNSATSFNRAFKNYFNITPTECRKQKYNYQLFPKIYFEEPNKDNKGDLSYEIEILKKFDLYCYVVSSNNYNDVLYKIRRLYEQIKNDNIYENLLREGLYGIFTKNNNNYTYYLGTKTKSNLTSYTVEKGRYAVFSLNTKKQRDISEFELNIYKNFFSSTNYRMRDADIIELYNLEGCRIYLPIE